MNARTHRLACCLLVMSAAPLEAQEADQWIVLGSDASASMTIAIGAERGLSLEERRGFRVQRSAEGRTVARLSPALETLLQKTVHDEHDRCGGFTVHPTLEAALSEVDNPFYSAEYLNRSGLMPDTIDQHRHVLPALDLVDGERIVDTIEWLQRLGTRHFQSTAGRDAAIRLEASWAAHGAGRSDFSVARYPHEWLQDSVVATIEGVETPEEIVVIGGHLDSINAGDTANAPGADDDASGVAVVSEVLRVVLASGFRPRRTLQFMAYAAEEVGLRGSRAIASDYSDADRRVVAAMQLDMTGFAGSPRDMYFITDYVSADLNDFLKDLLAEYNAAGEHEITFGETACGYACSDHVSWTGTGVPAAFPFEARFEDHNDNIHTPRDVLENIDTSGEKQALFAKLGIEFVMEVAKGAGTAPPSPGGPIGYAWADKPAASGYAPAAAYAFNAAGGAIVANRSGPGRYSMTFAGLGGGNSAGANVQVSGYGASPTRCKVSSWRSRGDDLTANVRCFTSRGDPVDARYSVLVTWP